MPRHLGIYALYFRERPSQAGSNDGCIAVFGSPHRRDDD